MRYDLIIVGGGTAGLSAAIYALRGGLKTLVLEQLVHGGQIVASPEVKNYPGLADISGADYAQGLLEQANGLGLELKYEEVRRVQAAGRVKEVETSAAVYQAPALIWAAGAVPRVLNLPREQQLIGRGISFCATCDGALYKGREAAVVGGGNTAVEEALYLSQVCSRVHLLHRRSSFRAERANVQRLAASDNIRVHLNTRVIGYGGESRLEYLELQEDSQERRLPVAAVFLAIGRSPANSLIAGQIAVDEAGYAVAAEDCLTALPGVYVAGDCRTKPLRQLVTAAADGAVAASQAIAYLRQQGEQGKKQL